MHLPRLALLSLLGISALTTSGCNTSTPAAASPVSKVYVRDVAASSLHATDILANAVHDAGVRALSAQGYTVVATEGEADAVLRSSWQTQKSAGNRSDTPNISLSLSLFNKANRRLFDGNSGPGVAANFWNEGRATAEVTTILKGLPAPAKK
ncbi:MAG: hypothetical protein NTX41_06335 [Verrucomicrobia bacterium]|nr:hypothetical protein [Verrucomicrobiota bacterium]